MRGTGTGCGSLGVGTTAHTAEDVGGEGIQLAGHVDGVARGGGFVGGGEDGPRAVVWGGRAAGRGHATGRDAGRQGERCGASLPSLCLPGYLV